MEEKKLMKDKKVNGKCKICGEEELYWSDGGKIVCRACDNPQW